MKTRSQTPEITKQFGLRWTIAALLILFAVCSAHAQNGRSATAQLHISVTVVPILQAQIGFAAHHGTDTPAGVAYHLQIAAVKQTVEVRDKATTMQLVGTSSAVLKTATSVLE